MAHGMPMTETPGRRLSTSSQLTTLPPALLAQSARRLRAMALLYSFTFFVAGTLPVLILPAERTEFLGSVSRWLPSLLSVLSGLLVAWLTSRPSLSAEAVVRFGLVFQVVGSFGIACAEYLQPSTGSSLRSPMSGLSWVAVWVLGYSIAVPSPPRWALVAGFLSVSAVPVVSAVAMANDAMPLATPLRFFLHLILPYLLVVLIAGVGARLVYSLGADLKRALDLGSYRLVERLGQGGMGEVWRAQHRLLARPAAVKLIRPEVFDNATGQRQSELRMRFEREAQTTSRLQSPHTIGLFDYGVEDDGAFYYVMKLLDGFDLKRLVERFGPLPVERAVHLLKQACHSLAEAHAVGLVHRDITPANVFVCRYGRDVDFVKVLDFGLVKPQAWATVDDDGVTRADRVGGTPAFMSPEQAVGDRQIDGRSDLYSLGCLAYWMVTGTLVFQKSTPMAVAVAHAQAVPDPPSQRTELPIAASFEALVLECLAKQPEARPVSAEALAQRLDQLSDVPAWDMRQARAWWDLHHPVAPAGPGTE
ncbi:MAG: serine/threonine protein kinase [Acidobacteria bacterium]|nr:serine/threonine protein kinase [Acidobacteriota bacterium]